MAKDYSRKVVSDTLELYDMGKVVSPRDFHKVDGDDYVMYEDAEQIYFVIKSKSDEYVFTNYGLIHVDGANGVLEKRVVKRYDFYDYDVCDVTLETAGTIDLDVEIKFSFGDVQFSIDVDKNCINKLKDLYKALIEISRLQILNAELQRDSREALKLACETLSNSRTENLSVQLLKELVRFKYQWLRDFKELNNNKDFGEVFEKYI